MFDPAPSVSFTWPAGLTDLTRSLIPQQSRMSVLGPGTVAVTIALPLRLLSFGQDSLNEFGRAADGDGVANGLASTVRRAVPMLAASMTSPEQAPVIGCDPAPPAVNMRWHCD